MRVVPCAGVRIVITNAKGGTAKTTTTMLLGLALATDRQVLVLDADPQGSATEWAIRAQQDNDPLPLTVEPVNLAQLRHTTPTGSGQIILVDTPPGDPRI